MNPLIINRPSLQSSQQRIIYPVLTFLFWLLWIYIWLPLVSLIAWGFGVQLYYDEMILNHGLEALMNMAGIYAMVVLLIGTMLISWAVYNLKRFRNKERRSAIEKLSNEKLAEHFHVDTGDLTRWHDASRMVVHLNEKGDVERVETG